MADEGIGEALEDGRGVGAALGLGQRHCGRDLVEQHAARKAESCGSLRHLLDGVETGEKGGEHGRGMAAVEDAHLAGAVGLQIVGPDHVEAGLVRAAVRRRSPSAPRSPRRGKARPRPRAGPRSPIRGTARPPPPPGSPERCGRRACRGTRSSLRPRRRRRRRGPSGGRGRERCGGASRRSPRSARKAGKRGPGASGPSADQRAHRSAATLAGKLFGQTSGSSGSSASTMPASVVLETTKRRSRETPISRNRLHCA